MKMLDDHATFQELLEATKEFTVVITENELFDLNEEHSDYSSNAISISRESSESSKSGSKIVRLGLCREKPNKEESKRRVKAKIVTKEEI